MMSQARASHGKNSRSTRLGNVAQLSETTILYFSGPRLPSFCSAMIAIMAAFGVTFPKVYILAYDIGRNFGRTSSAYVITSYYDQAPLDEYALQYPMLATFRLLSTTITMRNFVMSPDDSAITIASIIRHHEIEYLASFEIGEHV
ncbi:hypothetical protein CCACVL1_05924 [Corchorus capsularis]|uniref:Uncharacterized protein n=1 Tax=Corchorus capsularis TaxID=210143 RepID=A0A1R3JI90_COCAP|nr:hypothetical protein CCACVL1_05924 [Corchorus capsularis]